MALALEGVRVLTVEEKLPVTYCSMLLGDLGADVIILERPGTGNPARSLPNFLVNTNRNKRSLTINLKSEKGREICYKLAQDCDVIIECMRPGVAQRLGIDYEAIKGINPRIIYCSVSGYGQDGPYRDWPGHDPSYLGVAGVLNFTPRDPEGVPQLPGIPVADLSSGMFVAMAVLSALFARDRLGGGQYIDVSMTDGLISWLSIQLGVYFDTGMSCEAVTEPAMGVFATKDHRYVTLSIAHEAYFWRNLCHAIGRPDLAELEREQRTQRRDELVAILKGALLTRTRDEWVKILSKANVPCAPLLSLEEVVCNPHFLQRGMIVEVKKPNGGKVKQVAYPTKFSETQPVIRRLSPALGEHTEEILASLGYSQQEFEALCEEGCV